MSITLRDCATGARAGPADPIAVDVSCRRHGERKRRPRPVRGRPASLPDTASGPTRAATHLPPASSAMILFDTPPAPPAPGFQTGWQVVASNVRPDRGRSVDPHGDRAVLRHQPESRIDRRVRREGPKGSAAKQGINQAQDVATPQGAEGCGDIEVRHHWKCASNARGARAIYFLTVPSCVASPTTSPGSILL